MDAANRGAAVDLDVHISAFGQQITHWGVWLVGNGNLRKQWDAYDQAEQVVLLELGRALQLNPL